MSKVLFFPFAKILRYPSASKLEVLSDYQRRIKKCHNEIHKECSEDRYQYVLRNQMMADTFRERWTVIDGDATVNESRMNYP